MRSFVRLSVVGIALLSGSLALVQPAVAAAVAASSSWSSRTESYINAARERTLDAAKAKGI